MHLGCFKGLGFIVLGFAAHPFNISGTGDEDIVYDLSGYDLVFDHGDGDSGPDYPADS